MVPHLIVALYLGLLNNRIIVIQSVAEGSHSHNQIDWLVRNGLIRIAQ